QAPRLLDKDEVFLGECEDRDLREVDLLVAGELQQQAQRPLEAVDVDDETLVLGADVRFEFRFAEARCGRAHAGLSPSSRSKRLSSAARSTGSEARRNASARSLRRRASPASSGTFAAISSISSRTPLQ